MRGNRVFLLEAKNVSNPAAAAVKKGVYPDACCDRVGSAFRLRNGFCMTGLLNPKSSEISKEKKVFYCMMISRCLYTPGHDIFLLRYKVPWCSSFDFSPKSQFFGGGLKLSN